MIADQNMDKSKNIYSLQRKYCCQNLLIAQKNINQNKQEFYNRLIDQSLVNWLNIWREYLQKYHGTKIFSLHN
ncbi:unnamed protein product [Paramecium octaurelia]|uniref:Uncharacterized protein n=1 Tax=Paramecium octaurelia TaxID=43137 RepID=A0A8S1S0Y5_PAROT|nr:unnamed protein product [Paramecium octaurelia]